MGNDERLAVFWKVMGEAFRPGVVNDMIVKLQKMGFFQAPASTKYHGNYEGGLFNHSVAVTNALLKLTRDLDLTWSRKESPYIVGMYHDLCKCDQYQRKQEGGWEYNPNMTLNGHGEKSVILTQRLITLTEEEMLCIRWHMGAYDKEENWGYYNRAVNQYPNVLYTHTADMIAAHIEGV